MHVIPSSFDDQEIAKFEGGVHFQTKDRGSNISLVRVTKKYPKIQKQYKVLKISIAHLLVILSLVCGNWPLANSDWRSQQFNNQLVWAQLSQLSYTNSGHGAFRYLVPRGTEDRWLCLYSVHLVENQIMIVSIYFLNWISPTSKDVLVVEEGWKYTFCLHWGNERTRVTCKSCEELFAWMLVNWLVVLRIYVALAVFHQYHDLEAGDNQSLKFKWRDRESNPGPLAPQAKSLTTRPPPLPRMYACATANMHI